jgi:hypothetical protein
MGLCVVNLVRYARMNNKDTHHMGITSYNGTHPPVWAFFMFRLEPGLSIGHNPNFLSKRAQNDQSDIQHKHAIII